MRSQFDPGINDEVPQPPDNASDQDDFSNLNQKQRRSTYRERRFDQDINSPNLQQNRGTFSHDTAARVGQPRRNVGGPDQKQNLNDSGQERQFRGVSVIDDQYFKKQMEFKGGRLHQLITDQMVNSNRIFANRYQGFLGVWYFLIDSTFHFENVLSLMLFVLIQVNEFEMIDSSYPIVALTINVFLMSIRNVVFEMRQRTVTNNINNKACELLWITRKFKRYVPGNWAECKPGNIIQIRAGQEFPADCLLLDIAGQDQKCYITTGPFDDSTGIIQKKSYAATSYKVGNSSSGGHQNSEHIAEMISGLLKYEYNYFGYIQGSFKLNDNPTAIDFDKDNVVQRGALLTHTSCVTCLVLNVGDQCMGSVYKDPKSAMDSSTHQRLKSFVKTQKSFDKAYKQSIRQFLISLAVTYMAFSFLAIYLASTERFFNVASFERNVIETEEISTSFYFQKGMGFFSILLSSIPLSFSNIIDLLVLMHTNFAEWDVDITPADIDFIQPHATLAFGKVAHMFFSRRALQMDDKQAVKLFHVGGHFYKNQYNVLDTRKNRENDPMDSDSDEEETKKQDETDNQTNELEDENFLDSAFQYESLNDELSLDYLPNEIKYTQKFYNSECDQILQGPESGTKNLIQDFFRAITLCHQINVMKDLNYIESNGYQYIGVFNDEIASLEFAKQQGFQLIKRNKKLLTLILQGKQEKYEELGVVTTKAVMGHFMTISATRRQGQMEGNLYMKGSIASMKPYFQFREKDAKYLNMFEQKFIQSGLHAVVYAKRKLTLEETNQLIITINEGISTTKENSKLDLLLQNLTSIQLEILGMLGVQRAVHLRNRVAVDDMSLNGVKPWIVSKEDEQTHLTCLNSLRIMENCSAPLVINGTRERVVTDQIMNALKLVTDRMAARAQYSKGDNQTEEEEITQTGIFYEAPLTNPSHSTRHASSINKASAKNSRSKKNNVNEDLNATNENSEAEASKNLRNVVVFTGRALQEITRDMTMQKAFMTLAYLSDMMIGSEITPIQKQKLLKIAKSYVGEGEYAAAIVTTPEDQFMVNEADLCANLKVKGKSADFQAVVDVTLKDFSAVSYLLFKHGNQIQMRLSKAAQAFFYRSLVTFLILTTYMIQSGFSGSLPYTNFYYYMFMLIIAPFSILVFATFYKDVGYEYLYRIYGHYKYNFSFSLVETEFVVVDSISAIFDWAVIYLPHEYSGFIRTVTVVDNSPLSSQTYYAYQVILLQIIFLFYFRNTAVQVNYSMSILIMLTIFGCSMILDDDQLVGTSQFFTSPNLLLTLVWQLFTLCLRNLAVDVMAKLVIRRYADLHDWYSQIEDKLSFEMYEDPDQQFTIQQFTPLFIKINSSNIKNTLKLINLNMMKVPKSDALEQILDKVNTELAIDKRSIEFGGTKSKSTNIFGSSLTKDGNINHQVEGTQMALSSGSINPLTLTLNDMNQETEYQENKNLREIVYVRRQMVVFILTTMAFSLFGLILTLSIDYTNLGIYYYLGLSFFTFVIYHILPQLTHYISNTLLFYTIVVIFCYTIYTSNDASLQPTGLIFVLALVAGLNHSYIYPTMMMILSSVLMHVFFSVLADFENDTTNFNNTYRVCLWMFVAIVWSVYVYMQELEKKTSFVSGHKKVRNFQKLKQILNILVPSLVRDKIRSGKKNFSDEEGVVTIIFIDIFAFDSIVESYKGQELLGLLDQVYNAFDQLCDQFGLQKIETVGKTYMACGGLKSAERKIEQRLLNKHHSVRVTDFALEVIQYAKSIYLKNGKQLEVSVGVHTGPVISGVVGDTKPQFSLIGDTVNKTSRVCSKGVPQKVGISQETKHFLELYTNNLAYQQIMVEMKGLGQQPIYLVSVASKGLRIIKAREANRENQITQAMNVQANTISKDTKNIDGLQNLAESGDAGDEGLEDYELKESDEGNSRGRDGTPPDSHRNMLDSASENNFDQAQNQFNDEGDNESARTGQIDEGTMNVFGFNDDMNLDDRIIVQNATDNQTYQVVERPRNLLSFDNKDLEQDFLYQISKAERKKTTIFLALLIILNKVVILADIIQEGGEFDFTFQFYLMFPIFLFELVLIYKLNNPQLEYVHVWTYSLLIYGIIVLLVLLTFQAKYIGQWTRAGFNELQIQLTLSLIFFMRNVMLRHFIITYIVYMICWITFLIVVAQEFYYQIPQFIIGQVMYALLLAVGIHHREMIQRKSLNYERILNVEINKTNDIISNLVPFHMVNVIKNQKRHVDEFSDCTLLFTDMVKFTAFSKNAKDPKEVVNLLSKLFSRFDQLCEQNKVYKVHTIGDCYVIMGYNGRLDKSKRNHAVVIDEAERVLETGMEMIEIIQEVRNVSENADLRELDMRIGIHTGRVVAGIIGTKVVRYDIFGEGVLIANKMESNGIPGQVCISKDTKEILCSYNEISRKFNFNPHNTVNLTKIGKQVDTFLVERRTNSFQSSQFLDTDEYGESQDRSFNQTESDSSNEQLNSSSSEEELEVVDKVEGEPQLEKMPVYTKEFKTHSTIAEMRKRITPQFIRSPVLRSVASMQGNISQDRSISSNSQVTFAGNNVFNLKNQNTEEYLEAEKELKNKIDPPLFEMIQRYSEPTNLTRSQVSNSNWFLGIGLAFILAFIIISIGQGFVEIKATKDYDTLMRQVDPVLQWEAVLYNDAVARRDLIKQQVVANPPTTKFTRSFFNPKYTLVIVFKHLHNHDPNCLYSVENQQGMYLINQALKNNPRFSEFCLTQSSVDNSCHDTKSFISLQDMFEDYTPDGWTGIMEANQRQVNQSFKEIYPNPVAWRKYGQLMEKNYTIEDFRPHFVRSFLHIGTPLSLDIQNYSKSFKEMEDEIYQYHKELREIVKNVNNTNGLIELFETYVTSELLTERDSIELFNQDLANLWIIALVYGVIKIFQLRSLTMTIIVVILGSATIPIGQLFYRGLINLEQLTQLQSTMLVLFLGVYFDYMATIIIQWRQSGKIKIFRLNWKRRLAYVYNRNIRGLCTANFIFSLTLLFILINEVDFVDQTALALFCWNLTQLTLVILLLPPIIIIYERHIKGLVQISSNLLLTGLRSGVKKFKKMRPGQSEVNQHDREDLYSDEDELSDQEESHSNYYNENSGQQKKIKSRVIYKPKHEKHQKKWKDRQMQLSHMITHDAEELRKSKKETEAKNEQSEQNLEREHLMTQLSNLTDLEVSYVQRWMIQYLNKFVHKYRWAIIGVMIGWFIATLINVIRLEAAQMTIFINHLGDDVSIQQAHLYNEDRFERADHEQVRVQFIFGIKNFERNKVTTELAASKDLWAHEMQDIGNVYYDSNFDNLLNNYTQEFFMNTCNTFDNEAMIKEGTVNCWLRSFKTWFENKHRNHQNAGQYTIPFQGDKVYLNNNYREWAENTEEGRKVENDQIIRFNYERTHIVVTKIEVVAESVGRNNHTGVKREAYERFEGLLKSIKAKAPQSLKSIFQTSKNGEWALLHSEQTLVTSVQVAILVNFAISFGVLTYSTKNYIIGLIASCCVTMVLISVGGVLNLAGYKIDVTTTLILLITGGFSYNYITLLTLFYVKSSFTTRYERMGHALYEIGPLIIASFTTLFPTALMLLSFQSGTLYRVAVLLIFAILSSFIISMFLFPSICHVTGPAGNQGIVKQLSLSYLLNKSESWEQFKTKSSNFKQWVINKLEYFDPIFGDYNYPRQVYFEKREQSEMQAQKPKEESNVSDTFN